jgi:hypothetical protein
MSVANQQSTSQMRGVAPSGTVITGGAIVLILITAAVSWLAYGAIAPRDSVAPVAAAGAAGAAASVANPALVEFRQGEQTASASVGGFIPAAGLVEFRQGERGASLVAGNFAPAAGLVEFRHGEQTH